MVRLQLPSEQKEKMIDHASIDPQRFLELEYQQIRAEILKRIELRQQLIQITLTFAGALIGISVQSQNALIALIYPPLAFCFSMLWAQNDIRGRQLGQYIREVLEDGKGGWESFYRNRLHKETMLGKYSLSIFAPGGAFLISEFVAIALAIFNASNRFGFWWVLVLIDVLFFIGTVILVRKVLKNRHSAVKSMTTRA